MVAAMSVNDVPEAKLNSRLPSTPATSIVNTSPSLVAPMLVPPPAESTRPALWADWVTMTLRSRSSPLAIFAALTVMSLTSGP